MRLEPVTVEIVTYAPTEFFHCTHCEVVFHHVGLGRQVHAEQRSSNLPADLQEEYRALSDWVEQTYACHPDAVQIKVIDAASLEGVFKTLRYRIRRFPAVVVDGRETIIGDLEAASRAVERRLSARSGYIADAAAGASAE